jgi:hypothetical protein
MRSLAHPQQSLFMLLDGNDMKACKLGRCVPNNGIGMPIGFVVSTKKMDSRDIQKRTQHSANKHIFSVAAEEYQIGLPLGDHVDGTF